MKTAKGDPMHSLAWGVETSIRYHERRQAYYERTDAVVNSVNLIAGSSAVLAIAKDASTEMVLWLSAFVAVISLLNLTMRSSQMASLHAQLKQQFVDLLKRIKRVDRSAPALESSMRLLERRRLDIEMQEPPIFRVVCVLAHNELAFANGYGDDAIWHVPWWKQLTSHFVRWESSNLKTRASRKAERGKAS